MAVGRRQPARAPAREPVRLPLAWRSGLTVTVAVSAVLLVGGGLSLPVDLGTWAPAALPGQPVFALAPAADGILAGSGRGLLLLREDGSVRDLGVHARVNAIVHAPGTVLVGTVDGVLALPVTGATIGAATRAGLAGGEVLALATAEGVTWAGSATGLYWAAPGGPWQRAWPESGRPGSPVPAVLVVGGMVLFSSPDQLSVYDPVTGTLRVVADGVSVVSLSATAGRSHLWAGLRGSPLLLSSSDAGRTWQPRSEGLGFTAVNAVISDPSGSGRLIAGGSGLADGSGNAGVEVSDDDGRTWRARQNRLSNTHVFALLGRPEALRLGLQVPGLPGSASLALPVHAGRTYAGTNGGGVYSQRPSNALVGALAAGRPALRLVEPLLAGLLVLACVLAAYRRLTPSAPLPRSGSGDPPSSGVPGRGPPGAEAPRPRGRDPDG